MKPGRGPQQGGQIRLSGGGGRPQPGSFAKPIRKYPDQPVVVFGGAGRPDPEGQRATFCGVCRTLGQYRSTQRKVPCGLPDEDRLTEDIIELVRQFGRYGYRMITGMLNNVGWHVNHMA